MIWKYFWRTAAQQEIDYLEELNGKMTAHEFKWNPNKTVKFSSTFTKANPEAEVKLITPTNFEEFVLGKPKNKKSMSKKSKPDAIYYL